jgi:LysR family hydrogen peroxide-inducible transcriptional activator
LGEEVIRRARLILRETDDLIAVAKGRQMFNGQLRLGVLPSVGPFILPNVLRRLHAEHPNLRLILKDESTLALEEGLRSGQMDLIISTPQDHPNTLQIPLFQERFWAAFAFDDPLGQSSGPIGRDDLKDKTLLTLDRSHRLVAAHRKDIQLRPISLPAAMRDLALIQKRRAQPTAESEILAQALSKEAEHYLG